MTKTVVPEAKKAKKTRKKTEKSGTAKKTTKEGVKRKRAKDMGMKVSEEAMLEQKAKEEALKNEALDFYRLLRQQFGLEPFDKRTTSLAPSRAGRRSGKVARSKASRAQS